MTPHLIMTKDKDNQDLSNGCYFQCHQVCILRAASLRVTHIAHVESPARNKNSMLNKTERVGLRSETGLNLVDIKSYRV